MYQIVKGVSLKLLPEVKQHNIEMFYSCGFFPESISLNETKQIERMFLNLMENKIDKQEIEEIYYLVKKKIKPDPATIFISCPESVLLLVKNTFEVTEQQLKKIEDNWIYTNIDILINAVYKQISKIYPIDQDDIEAIIKLADKGSNSFPNIETIHLN